MSDCGDAVGVAAFAMFGAVFAAALIALAIRRAIAWTWTRRAAREAEPLPRARVIR